MQDLPKDVTVLESYPVNAPYAFVHVTRDMARGNITYNVEEPKLNKTDQENLERLKITLNQVLDIKPKDLKSKQAAGEYLVKKSNEIFDNYNFNLEPDTRSKATLLCSQR